MKNIYDGKESFCVNADCFSQHVVDKLLRGSLAKTREAAFSELRDSRDAEF